MILSCNVKSHLWFRLQEMAFWRQNYITHCCESLLIYLKGCSVHGVQRIYLWYIYPKYLLLDMNAFERFVTLHITTKIVFVCILRARYTLAQDIYTETVTWYQYSVSYFPIVRQITWLGRLTGWNVLCYFTHTLIKAISSRNQTRNAVLLQLIKDSMTLVIYLRERVLH